METASFCVSTFSAPDFDAEEIRATVASAFNENRTVVPPQYDLSKNEKGAFGAQVHLMPSLELLIVSRSNLFDHFPFCFFHVNI